jgi:hypothetical protein
MRRVSMIIFREKDRLDEMSYPCKKSDGYGMIIEVHSNDHGVIGNARSPAHAHLRTVEEREIGEFEITEDAPDTPNEIRWYRTNKIPDGYGARIVKWAKGGNKYGINNWIFLKATWTSREP